MARISRTLYKGREGLKFIGLAVIHIFEEEEEASLSLLGGRRNQERRLMEEGNSSEVGGRKVYDEGEYGVEIPETAHQISSGSNSLLFLFVLLDFLRFILDALWSFILMCMRVKYDRNLGIMLSVDVLNEMFVFL